MINELDQLEWKYGSFTGDQTAQAILSAKAGIKYVIKSITISAEADLIGSFGYDLIGIHPFKVLAGTIESYFTRVELPVNKALNITTLIGAGNDMEYTIGYKQVPETIG